MARITIADQLRAAINECEWSLNSIAAEIGIPQPVLYRFASGQRDVTLANAEKIACYFDMSLSEPKPK